jgi:hydrogenase maturation protease
MDGAQALVIGIGNRLRSDDGAAIQLAEKRAGQRPTLQVLLCNQLTPELADPIHQARAVLFVDAWMAEPPACDPLLTALQASPSGDLGGHALTPPRLLALCAALYGAYPPAWELLIPGHCWDVGDELSSTAAAASAAAVLLLLQWEAAHA